MSGRRLGGRTPLTRVGLLFGRYLSQPVIRRLEHDVRAATFAAILVAVGACICPAQQRSVPFAEIEREAKLPAALEISESPTDTSEWSPVVVAPQVASSARLSSLARLKTMDAHYFLINGAHLTMAVVDIGMTQHCIAAHHCTEGNPLMPKSFTAQLTVELSLVGLGSGASYSMKKQRSREWWIIPALGAVAHGVGAISGLRYY